MLENAQWEYVSETLGSAAVPQDKSEPKGPLIVIVAIMLGGIFGLCLVFARTFTKRGADEHVAAHV